jgi:hypothetical protein
MGVLARAVLHGAKRRRRRKENQLTAIFDLSLQNREILEDVILASVTCLTEVTGYTACQVLFGSSEVLELNLRY